MGKGNDVDATPERKFAAQVTSDDGQSKQNSPRDKQTTRRADAEPTQADKQQSKDVVLNGPAGGSIPGTVKPKL